MIFPNLRLQFEIGRQKRSAEFGDQFLHRVPLIAEPLASEVAIKARLVAGPVGHFVGAGGIIAFGVAKVLERWHLHEVLRDIVISPVAAMQDGGAGEALAASPSSQHEAGPRMGPGFFLRARICRARERAALVMARSCSTISVNDENCHLLREYHIQRNHNMHTIIG